MSAGCEFATVWAFTESGTRPSRNAKLIKKRSFISHSQPNHDSAEHEQTTPPVTQVAKHYRRREILIQVRRCQGVGNMPIRG
jgi:hypothetical protein